jgi:hypothetical protein
MSHATHYEIWGLLIEGSYFSALLWYGKCTINQCGGEHVVL